MILGIDTSAGQCAVALVSGRGEILAEQCERLSRGHAERLFPMIDDALAAAGAGYTEIERIGVVTGPGSFTGIRVGIAGARGLSLGAQIPAIGISRFSALLAGRPTVRAVALAGPRDQVFLQLYDEERQRTSQAVLVPRADAEALIGGQSAVGDAFGPVEDGLASAATVALLARDAEPGPPPAPLYLRGADADPPRQPPMVWLD